MVCGLYLQGRTCAAMKLYNGELNLFSNSQVNGLAALMDGEHVGPFNLGNPGEFTMLELAQVPSLILKFDSHYFPYNKVPVRSSCCDILTLHSLKWI
jgi:hypothetical protein